ncbi:MAG: Gfo/Idh/MocA family oxidoreductase [bacterium]
MIRYAVIGCGVIGPVHAQAISQIPEAQLMAVCDVDIARAQKVADEYNVAVVMEDYRQILERDDIDAICICVPHYLHAQIAIEAAEAGKHIFCEKPMAIDPEDMDNMIDAADDAGVQLGICFQHRFDPVMIELKKMVDEGKFGKLLMGSAQVICLRDEAYYASEDWRGKWETEGGGVLINQAIHTIDLMMWIFGEAESISGTYNTLRWDEIIEVEDTAVGVVEFENGAIGHINATSASNLNWDTSFHVYGTKGSAVVNTGFPNTFTKFEVEGMDAAPQINDEDCPTVGKACYGNSHYHAINAFTQALITNTPYPIDGHQARQAVEVVLGLYNSCDDERKVLLPLSEDEQMMLDLEDND